MARSYENFDEFQRDLDDERFSEDPFDLNPEVGLLDDDDLVALGALPKPKKRRA